MFSKVGRLSGILLRHCTKATGIPGDSIPILRVCSVIDGYGIGGGRTQLLPALVI